MRIVVSGGGSAGHISPALAVCDALKRLDSGVELLYIGQADGMEARIVAAAGLKFVAIKAGKFRRLPLAHPVVQLLSPSTLGPNARDVGRVVQGVTGAIKALRAFKPDIVFLKGGYVCLPVGLAARMLGIPYVIHESDLSPGLANRILGRWAVRIGTGFPVKGYKIFDPAKLVFTGNPVPPDRLQTERAEGLKVFGLDPEVPVVFVTGGSQGAAQVNDAVLGALEELLPYCQIIHQTGEGDYERVKFELSRLGKMPQMERYVPRAFLSAEMAAAYAVADVVVARAGANTIADLAVQGKAAVLIPNYQMAGHQIENARVLSRAGAARVLNGAGLRPAQLAGEIRRLLDDPPERERLGRAIRQFGRPQAAAELAQLVLAMGREGKA